MYKFIIMFLVILLLMVIGGHFLSHPTAPPVGNARAECADSVDVYVLDKGIHTAIVVPVEGGGIDWTEFIDPDSISPYANPPYNYLEFGMGDEAFYINTPEWKDLRLRILFPALFWRTSGVIHVTGRQREPVFGNVINISIDGCKYRSMAHFIQGSFALEGGTQVFVSEGYHHDDGFFKANQNYHLFYTCNNWVAEALQHAGKSTPLWPLFPASIMRHLKD